MKQRGWQQLDKTWGTKPNDVCEDALNYADEYIPLIPVKNAEYNDQDFKNVIS